MFKKLNFQGKAFKSSALYFAVNSVHLNIFILFIFEK